MHIAAALRLRAVRHRLAHSGSILRLRWQPIAARGMAGVLPLYWHKTLQPRHLLARTCWATNVPLMTAARRWPHIAAAPSRGKQRRTSSRVHRVDLFIVLGDVEV